MTEDAALLAAVAAGPADDLPRLAFADWLDERGAAGDAVRAAFIRLQCEAARYEVGDRRLAPVMGRLRALFGENAQVLVGPFAPFLGGDVVDATVDRNGRCVAGGANDNYLTLERGFGTELILGDAADLERAWEWEPPGGPGPVLTLRDPVPLDVTRTTPAPFDLWAATPLFGWAAGARLDFRQPAWMCDTYFEQLAAAPPFLGRLHGLSVAVPHVSDFGVLPLLRAGALTALADLRFVHCDLSPAVVDVLAGSPRFAGLASLGFAGSVDLGYEVNRFYRPGGWPALRTLDLSACGLDDFDAAELGRYPYFERLEALSVADNQITRDGFATLLGSPHWPMLGRLNLAGNPLSATEVRRLVLRYGDDVEIVTRG